MMKGLIVVSTVPTLAGCCELRMAKMTPTIPMEEANPAMKMRMFQIAFRTGVQNDHEKRVLGRGHRMKTQIEKEKAKAAQARLISPVEPLVAENIVENAMPGKCHRTRTFV
jgi:hypothetical protein